jgi:hypothetical protein
MAAGAPTGPGDRAAAVCIESPNALAVYQDDSGSVRKRITIVVGRDVAAGDCAKGLEYVIFGYREWLCASSCTLTKRLVGYDFAPSAFEFRTPFASLHAIANVELFDVLAGSDTGTSILLDVTWAGGPSKPSVSRTDFGSCFDTVITRQATVAGTAAGAYDDLDLSSDFGGTPLADAAIESVMEVCN